MSDYLNERSWNEDEDYTFNDDESLEYADLTDLGDLSDLIQADINQRVRDLGF